MNNCEWQINQSRMDRVVCSFGIVSSVGETATGSQPLRSTGDSRTREGQIMLSTQERCKCAVLEIAAKGKEVVVFREVRLFALRSGGRRGCAGGVKRHPNSSNSAILPPCFTSSAPTFGEKGRKYGKADSFLYISLQLVWLIHKIARCLNLEQQNAYILRT